MNDNNKQKNFSTLSEQLSGIFDHMELINTSFKRIEAYVEQQYKNIEKEINPDSNCDISKELQYHMAHFLRNLASDFEKKNRFFD